jgi:hypothetical protein
MDTSASSIVWRRLDTPGHDTCRVERRAAGWFLSGTAVFVHQGSPAQLAYDVACDPLWRAREGNVRGWVGARAIAFHVSRTPDGIWMFNDVTASGVGVNDCVDVDFGFTPATNLPQLRRLNLAIGQAADAPAAWLDIDSGRLERLRQRYERRSESTYWYEAPRFGYAALLELTPAGFIRRYPELWEAEPLR